MKRLTFCLLICTALSGAGLVTGCTSSNTTPHDSQANANPYAGGNGAFGEDPSNPGQYASSKLDAAHQDR
jgi:hypothetical protein